MAYSVKKNLAGRLRVHYVCLHCQGELESPLEEAGQKFKCPTCGQPVETPGTPELQKYRTADEQRRHAMVEQKRLQQIEAAAALELAANQRREQDQQRVRQRQQTAEKRSFSDLLLGVAFKFAKAVSVLVIIGCFGTVAVCAVMLATTFPQAPKSTVEVFTAPALPEYQDFVKSMSQQSNQNNSSDGQASGAFSGNSDFDRFGNLLRRFAIEPATYTEDFTRLGSEGQPMLVNGLVQFINSTGTAVPASASAVIWYISTFVERWNHVQESKAEIAHEREQAEAAASARRQLLAVSIGCAIAVLLSFLFLPLLIQIEQNTRQTLELHTELRRQ